MSSALVFKNDFSSPHTVKPLWVHEPVASGSHALGGLRRFQIGALYFLVTSNRLQGYLQAVFVFLEASFQPLLNADTAT